MMASWIRKHSNCYLKRTMSSWASKTSRDSSTRRGITQAVSALTTLTRSGWSNRIWTCKSPCLGNGPFKNLNKKLRRLKQASPPPITLNFHVPRKPVALSSRRTSSSNSWMLRLKQLRPSPSRTLSLKFWANQHQRENWKPLIWRSKRTPTALSKTLVKSRQPNAKWIQCCPPLTPLSRSPGRPLGSTATKNKTCWASRLKTTRRASTLSTTRPAILRSQRQSTCNIFCINRATT